MLRIFNRKPKAEENTSTKAEAAKSPVATKSPITTPAPAKGFFGRLRKGLAKTASGITSVFTPGRKIDAELLEELETQLLMADVGVTLTTEIIDQLTKQHKANKLTDLASLQEELKKLLLAVLQPANQAFTFTEDATQSILVVGVNGVGKTTTIGKLAKYFQAEGKKVMLAAGDTFRAAAVEQLQTWGERNQVPVIAQHTGADSASVLFDALSAAKARQIDVLLADTAGRLHNKSNLMEELAKIRRVMQKQDAASPQHTLLVLDAATGQNALSQAKEFNQAVPLTGLVVTKLDGSAKGGIVFALAKELQLPVFFIGVGEQAEDLRPFDAEDFVSALLNLEETPASA